MYAIIAIGGRQWKVEPGTQLDVNRLTTEVGARHLVDQVLFAHDGDQVQVGRPYVEGARVVCEVIAHRQGPKVIAYHYRRRENWRRTVGHRQQLTRLVVKEILMAGAQPEAEAPKASQQAAPSAKAAKPAKASAPHSVKPAAKRASRPPKAASSR